MHKTTLSIGLTLGLSLSTALVATGAGAAAISGKADLVCASVNVVGCTENNCLQGQAHTFDMPTFMFVDVKRKLVHSTDKGNKEVSSPIKAFEITENAIILQGFENHRGWTLGIERKTGEMTMSATGADVSFMVFGNCTER